MRKLLLLFLTIFLIPSLLFSATQLKKTVKSADGDYTSLSACMNANEQDLVSNDKYFDVEIDGVWASEDTTACIVDNYTTDTTRHINIYTTATARHDGKWKATAYTMKNGSALHINGVKHVSVTGIQIDLNETVAGVGIKISDPDGGHNAVDILIDKCIIKNGDLTSWTPPSKGFQSGLFTSGCVRNTLIYSVGMGMSDYNNLGSNAYPAWLFYNCVIRDIPVSGFSNTYGILYNGTGYTIVNCAVFDVGTAGNDFGGASLTIFRCASDDGDGTSAVTPADWDAVFTDQDNGDFSLESTDTDLTGAGFNLSLTFTDDIIGATRTSPWDIGAYKAEGGGDITQAYFIRKKKGIFFVK